MKALYLNLGLQGSHPKDTSILGDCPQINGSLSVALMPYAPMNSVVYSPDRSCIWPRLESISLYCDWDRHWMVTWSGYVLTKSMFFDATLDHWDLLARQNRSELLMDLPDINVCAIEIANDFYRHIFKG